MIPFYWFDLFLIPGIFQGIFISVMLFRIEKRNVAANKVLAIILLMAVLMLLGRLLWARYPENWSQVWSLLPDTTIFLFGPLIYLYIKTLLYQQDEENSIRLSLFHFVPALTHVAICLYLIVSFTKIEFTNMLINRQLVNYYLLSEEVAIALNLIYWFLDFKLIRKYKNEEKHKLSFEQSPVKYLTYFHFALLSCLVMWVISFANILWFRIGMYFINYDLIWTAIPICIYLVAYYSLKQPALFRIQDDIPVPKMQVSRLKPHDVESLQSALNEAINKHKIFIDNELTLATLAKFLDTSPNNLSWLLNEVYNKSFYDYVNALRIKEFVSKVNAGEHIQKTLLALAIEVGFNSKSTFNKAFRLEMDCTPSDFIKNIIGDDANPEFQIKKAV